MSEGVQAARSRTDVGHATCVSGSLWRSQRGGLVPADRAAQQTPPRNPDRMAVLRRRRRLCRCRSRNGRNACAAPSTAFRSRFTILSSAGVRGPPQRRRVLVRSGQALRPVPGRHGSAGSDRRAEQGQQFGIEPPFAGRSRSGCHSAGRFDFGEACAADAAEADLDDAGNMWHLARSAHRARIAVALPMHLVAPVEMGVDLTSLDLGRQDIGCRSGRLPPGYNGQIQTGPEQEN